MRSTVSAAALAIFMPWIATGQSATAVAFEVASIKPAPLQAAGRMSARMSVDAGRLHYTNVSLMDVIKQAYLVQGSQISGPAWLGADRFDIAAKIPDGVPKDQVPQMLQALMADRFKLALHRETKDLAMYSLTAAKGGPKLSTAESIGGVTTNTSGLKHHITANYDMARLADFLSQQVDRPVVDHTELKGAFHIVLDWVADAVQSAAPAAEASAPAGPSFLTAVQEQLGLKLVAQKGPVEVLVIDRAAKNPTEN
jgi:uncharacterized protein (TIGR03435 family)